MDSSRSSLHLPHSPTVTSYINYCHCIKGTGNNFEGHCLLRSLCILLHVKHFSLGLGTYLAQLTGACGQVMGLFVAMTPVEIPHLPPLQLPGNIRYWFGASLNKEFCHLLVGMGRVSVLQLQDFVLLQFCNMNLLLSYFPKACSNLLA